MGLDFLKKTISNNTEDYNAKKLAKAGGIETEKGRIIGNKIDYEEADNLKQSFLKRYGASSVNHDKVTPKKADEKIKKEDKTLLKAGGIETEKGRIIGNKIDYEEAESLQQSFLKRSYSASIVNVPTDETKKTEKVDNGSEHYKEQKEEIKKTINEIKELKKELTGIYSSYIDSAVDKIKSEYSDVAIKKKDFTYHFDDDVFLIIDNINLSLKTVGKNPKNISQEIIKQTITLNSNLLGLDLVNNIFGNTENLLKNVKRILTTNIYITKLRINLSGSDDEDIDSFIETIKLSGLKELIVDSNTFEKISKKLDTTKLKLKIITLEGSSENYENNSGIKNNKVEENTIPVDIKSKVEEYFKLFNAKYGNVLNYNVDDDDFLCIDKIMYFKNKRDSKEKFPNITAELANCLSKNNINKLDISSNYFCNKYLSKDKEGVTHENRNIFNFIYKALNPDVNETKNISIRVELQDFNDDEIDLFIEKISCTNVTEIILKSKNQKIQDKLSNELQGISVLCNEEIAQRKEKEKEQKEIEKKAELSKLVLLLKQTQNIKVEEKKEQIKSWKEEGIEKINSSSKFVMFEFVRFLFEQKLNSIQNEKEKQEYREFIEATRKLPKKDRRELYIDLTKEAFTGIAIHEKPDLDAKGILFLCKMAGLNFNFNNQSNNNISYLNKDINYIDQDDEINEEALVYSPNTLISDLSQTDGQNIFKTKGSRNTSQYIMALIDHHFSDSKKGNCATKQMFSIILKLGLIKDLDKVKNESENEYNKIPLNQIENFEFIKEIISFINREDDKYYDLKNYPGFSMDNNCFLNSHKTLYGYLKFINPNNIENIFNCTSLRNKYFTNKQKIPLEFIELTDEELKEIGLINLTGSELLVEYKKQFNEDLDLSSDIQELSKEYWSKKNSLYKEGKKEEKTNTKLEWLMDKSQKVRIYVDNNKLSSQIYEYKRNPGAVIYLQDFGKILIQRNIKFLQNPTDILICDGFDGYINYADNGKVFFISLFGDQYPQLSDELLKELENCGVIKIRGMLIKTKKTNANGEQLKVSNDLFNKVLNELKPNKNIQTKFRHNPLISKVQVINITQP